MLQIYRREAFIKMPWKNGLGETTEVAIFPPGSTLSKGDYAWRVSSAPVMTDTSFSQFPGARRILCPIQGQGFKLFNRTYSTFEVAEFSGDETCHCTLLHGPILDFGVIYVPSHCRVSWKILRLNTGDRVTFPYLGEYFVSILSGQVEYQRQTLDLLESLHFKDQAGVELLAKDSSILMQLQILV